MHAVILCVFADFAGAGGAAVDVPVVAVLVHSPILHAPHLAISVSVVRTATAASEVSRTVTSIAATPVAVAVAAAAAAAVCEFCQDDAHFFIFFRLQTQEKKHVESAKINSHRHKTEQNKEQQKVYVSFSLVCRESLN